MKVGKAGSRLLDTGNSKFNLSDLKWAIVSYQQRLDFRH